MNGNDSWIGIAIIGVIIIAIGLVQLPTPDSRGSGSGMTRTISEDKHLPISPRTRSGDSIDYWVEVRDGGPIDVYFMTESEYTNYSNGEDFSAIKQHHDRNYVRVSTEVHDSQKYYLVVDNMDNAKPDDTKSRGSVDVKLEIHWGVDNIFWQDGFPMLVCFGSLAVISLLLVLYRNRSRMRAAEIANLPKLFPEVESDDSPIPPQYQPPPGPPTPPSPPPPPSSPSPSQE